MLALLKTKIKKIRMWNISKSWCALQNNKKPKTY